MMVMAYALGLIAPTVAFANADRASVVHVLTESHGGMLVLHFHDGEGVHHDYPVKPGGSTAHQCCGLISHFGLEPGTAVAIISPRTTVTLLLPPMPSLSSCGPVCLERPPKHS